MSSNKPMRDLRVRFNLRTPKEKASVILLRLNWNYQTLQHYTGKSVPVNGWDKKLGRATRKYIDYSDLNDDLSDLETTVKRVFRTFYLNNDKEPNKKELKALVDAEIKNERKSVKHTLYSFIEAFIKEDRVNKHGQNIHARTIKKYRTSLGKLKKFRPRLDFDDIDYEFYLDFTKHLRQSNLSLNAIGKEISTLKVFLNAASERGINSNLKFRSKRFVVQTEESDSIYLNPSELDELYKLELGERLEKVRDLFLIGCGTGLRFSDFTRITADNVKGEMIHIEQYKTGDKVVIPLLPEFHVKEILEKYGYNLPRTISNQKMNDYLKEIGAKVPMLHDKIQISITKGGKRLTTWREKYSLITSHTARRSFATNLYRRDVPSISIMAITGHRTESSFLKYIKVSKEEHAQLIIDHFNESRKLKIVS